MKVHGHANNLGWNEITNIIINLENIISTIMSLISIFCRSSSKYCPYNTTSCYIVTPMFFKLMCVSRPFVKSSLCSLILLLFVKSLLSSRFSPVSINFTQNLQKIWQTTLEHFGEKNYTKLNLPMWCTRCASAKLIVLDWSVHVRWVRHILLHIFQTSCLPTRHWQFLHKNMFECKLITFVTEFFSWWCSAPRLLAEYHSS